MYWVKKNLQLRETTISVNPAENTAIIQNANKLCNHTGMGRDTVCFFFREEVRRDTGLRRGTVLFLEGIQVY